jgi:hypothetical protein
MFLQKKNQQTYSFFQYHPPKVAREIVQFFDGLMYTNICVQQTVEKLDN